MSVDRSAGEKIALIRHLFGGREDVYAERWENARTGKSGYAPAVEGGWAAARDDPKNYIEFCDATIERHLRGHVAIGIYPLLPGDRCRLLAFDLDARSSQREACVDGVRSSSFQSGQCRRTTSPIDQRGHIGRGRDRAAEVDADLAKAAAVLERRSDGTKKT